MGVEELTLETLLWEVTLKRSWAEVKRSTSRILAVMGRAVRYTRAPGSLKPFVLYTAEKGMQFSVDTFTPMKSVKLKQFKWVFNGIVCHLFIIKMAS